MNPADRMALAAAETVSSWPSADRAALIQRLSAAPVVTELNHGYSVDVGEDLPVWCADAATVGRLIRSRARLAAEVRDAA
ncbi:hypothetical protein ACWKSP_26145 [Micromonosporaceae bacterium Da 78-11]